MKSTHPRTTKRANKTDAGNGSKAICRVSNVLRSPSPDPKRSPQLYTPRLMRYPDGRAINVGDHVWWNEGVCIGYIEHVIETDDQIDSWGLSEPSIAVSNIHPFEGVSQKHPQEIRDVSLGGTVVYSSSDLADEGVGLLSASEEVEILWAVSLAISLISESDRGCPYRVTAHFDAALTMEHWHIHFLDRSGSILHHITLPFRPGTRSPA